MGENCFCCKREDVYFAQKKGRQKATKHPKTSTTPVRKKPKRGLWEHKIPQIEVVDEKQSKA